MTSTTGERTAEIGIASRGKYTLVTSPALFTRLMPPRPTAWAK